MCSKNEVEENGFPDFVPFGISFLCGLVSVAYPPVGLCLCQWQWGPLCSVGQWGSAGCVRAPGAESHVGAAVYIAFIGLR